MTQSANQLSGCIYIYLIGSAIQNTLLEVNLVGFNSTYFLESVIQIMMTVFFDETTDRSGSVSSNCRSETAVSLSWSLLVKDLVVTGKSTK